jgi:hypothetical protein
MRLNRFTVFKEDTSEEAATKLIKSFKMDEEMIPYFTKYIEERRILLDEENNYFNPTYSRRMYPTGNLKA